jgi:hypothetical protein
MNDQKTEAAAGSGYAGPDCSAADLRTAARIVRWASQTAKAQIKALPWWRRIFVGYPEQYLRLMVCNLEAMADLKQNDDLIGA